MMNARLNLAGRKAARRWIAAVACIALTTYTSTRTLAASGSDDEEELPDARLTGYEPVLPPIGNGVALSYALLAVLGVVSVGNTFKNANRSHLD